MRIPRLKPRLAAITLSLAFATILSGCGGDPDRIYAQSFGFVCSNHDNAAAHAACRDNSPGFGTETVSRFCYKTMGDPNCFDRPDQDRKNQEQGSSGY